MTDSAMQLIAPRRAASGKFAQAHIAGACLFSGLIALGIALALNVNGYYVFVLANVVLLAIVGIGLNVLMGLSGQISFGHVGFYAIGAYTVAILGKAGISFWIAWPAGALLAAALGGLLALPALRVKGPYLAMITIAFGFIVEHAIVEMRGLTGGQNGLMGIVAPSLGALASGERAVAIIAILAAGMLFICYLLLSRGTWGAALRAVRDSETAAESIGVNSLTVKAGAFAISAFCAGVAGGLFAPLSGFVTPHTFGFSQSILFVLAVMIGGAGSAIGPLAGALIVGVLPEALSSLEEFRLLFFGALLLVVLWVTPDGVTGMWRRICGLWRSRQNIVSKPPLPNAPSAAIERAPRARHSLRVDQISIRFGGVQAVADLSFDALPGKITSLIGPNGAGKTTAINILSGFYKPDSGSYALGETHLGASSAVSVARAGLARTYQTSQLFGSLSAIDNVALAGLRGSLGSLLGNARLRDTRVRERARELLEYCGYAGDPETQAANLPHVDRRLVEIARALALDPDMLLLDEPAAGLSSDDKQQLGSLLRKIAATGPGVILVEHDMPLVMSISDDIVVLDSGTRLAMGTPDEVQNNPAVRKAYLGESNDPGAPSESTKPNNDAIKTSAARPARSSPEMLGVNLLVTGYGAEPVLRGVDVQVRKGEVIALLGANGAGKSTLMRTLSGLHRPVISGGITLDGENIAMMDAESIVGRGMVLVPEGRQVFSELSVLENIRLGAFLNNAHLNSRVEEMLMRFPRLRERLNQRAGLLSGGEQQMLAVARALMSKPRVLLLDEPSLGLAPKVVAELFIILDQLRSEGMTMLLVDQMAALALSLADRAYIIERGQIVAEGDARSIAANPALMQAYLGSAQ